LKADDTAVYWTGQGKVRIKSVKAKAEDDVSAVITAPGASTLELDDRRIYWVEGQSVKTACKNDPTTVGTVFTSDGSEPKQLATDNDELYWITVDGTIRKAKKPD
jgi:streptogramin lyase